MYGHIYLITNTVNDKHYVGQTKRDPEIRFQEYRRGCYNVYLQRAFDRYGINNFKFEVIDYADSPEELDRKETNYILKYDSFGENGYNLCLGRNGPLGKKWDEKSRELVSKQRQGSRWFHNENGERRLVRADHIDEYKDWIPGYGPGRKKTSHSEETKQKIRASNAGKHQRTKTMLQKQVNTFTNNQWRWYTNGFDNLLISKNAAIPEGYYRGRTVDKRK